MTLWQQLQDTLKGCMDSCKPEAVDMDLLANVQALAERERRAPDEIILALLSQALESRHAEDRAYRCWESLSTRERQVAALVCCGLTGRQTAARLVLSPETVKTHMRHVLRKFNLRSRRELCALLSRWDLSIWTPSGCGHPAGEIQYNP